MLLFDMCKVAKNVYVARSVFTLVIVKTIGDYMSIFYTYKTFPPLFQLLFVL